MLWHQVGCLPASTDCLQVDKEDSNFIALCPYCLLTMLAGPIWTPIPAQSFTPEMVCPATAEL